MSNSSFSYPATRLVIARHGNTFNTGEIPTRVGLHTDIPLVEKGQEQARALGQNLMRRRLIPHVVFTSFLSRAVDTARLAMTQMSTGDIPTYQLGLFNEIDYGPDENQPEAMVIARVGEQAIDAWNTDAIPPQGWRVDVDAIKKGWKNFAQHVLEDYKGQTVLIVTSNGIARFAPEITGDFDDFKQNYGIKLSTGAYGVLQHGGGEHDAWDVTDWNFKPPM